LDERALFGGAFSVIDQSAGVVPTGREDFAPISPRRSFQQSRFLAPSSISGQF
jgi:hypothetical protein